MFFIDFTFAFVFALLLAGVLAALFGTRGVRRAGAWPIFLFLFVLLLAMTWAGGVWLSPFGPVFWGGYWLPFLVVGIIIALLIAALMPPARPPRSRSEAVDRAREEETATLALGAFFWMLVIVMVVAVVVRYV